jgi:hypothetical protein
VPTAGDRLVLKLLQAIRSIVFASSLYLTHPADCKQTKKQALVAQ